jgi:hypothetical protein
VIAGASALEFGTVREPDGVRERSFLVGVADVRAVEFGGGCGIFFLLKKLREFFGRSGDVQYPRHPNTTAVVRRAREIIADPARWTPALDAVGAEGIETHARHAKAVRFSGVGALDRAHGAH